MSDYSETVKVVSNNPEHGGYLVKNLSDVTDEDVIYSEKATKPVAAKVAAKVEVKAVEAATDEADEFENMSREDMLTYLKEQGENPHHMTGEAKLREACRKVAADLV